jgi:hypothetical protein
MLIILFKNNIVLEVKCDTNKWFSVLQHYVTDSLQINLQSVYQLAYGTSVVLLRCPFVPEIMHGRAHEVFLHQ